jgi:hypothetical protein
MDSAIAFAGPPNGLRKVWPIRDYNDMDDAYEYLRHERHPFKWLVFDSISGFQELGLDHIMEDLVVEKPHRKVDRPDKGEYGENMSRIKRWVRHTSALPLNFIINAHIFREDDEDGLYMPWVQGKGMPGAICGYMDVIGHVWIAEKDGVTKQVVDFRAREKFYARDRFGALPSMMPDPTIPKIEHLINNKLKEASTRGPTATKRVATKAPAKPVTKSVTKKSTNNRRK